MKNNKSESIPVMDYRQYRRARRLVHECCNYIDGNCIALDDGEECVCVQSISYSLLCRWFRAAVLPQDKELETALFHRMNAKKCIANALLDQDVPVLMTNFPTILNRLTGMFSEDRSEFIASFDEYDLLIIDDLGVERSTEYAMEQMFFVIDSRYRSRRPMIITTNLKLSELKNPTDLAHARIYDRILERCAPILFDGKNFREENAGATRQTAKDIVSSKQD